MKVYWIILIILLVVIGSIGIYHYQKEETDMKRTYPFPKELPYYEISEINSENFSMGEYNTYGYVVKIYECETCEWGNCPELVKLCMNPNIVISEKAKGVRDYSNLTQEDLIIFVDNPKQFEIGEFYDFSINIIERKTTDQFLNDVELSGYRQIIPL